MKYTALIGDPAGHSVSHILYRELAKTLNLTDFYEHIRLDVSSQELETGFEALKTLHFMGLSVTLPHKLAIMRYLDKLDSVTEELGAVNTISLGNSSIGYNTDWVGIVESIKQFAPQLNFQTATIFGTGGAARAAIYACKTLGIERINVLFRQPMSNGTKLLERQQNDQRICLQDYSEVRKSVAESQLIINATSAGMIGKDPQPFDLTTLDGLSLQGKVFLDAVFNPQDTPLMRFFNQGNAITIDGLWMMIHQGIKALSIWLGTEVPTTPDGLQDVHAILEKEITHNV